MTVRETPISVVPAKAGAHNHECELWRDAGAAAFV